MIPATNDKEEETQVILIKEYHPKLSKFEQECLEKAKERHKTNLTKPQYALGKKFEGDAFLSKPEKAIFKAI